MTEKQHTVILYESVLGSIVSDIFTFAVTAGLIFIADGRSPAWQAITIVIFFFWICAKTGMMGKVKKFYNKQELLKWVQSLQETEASK